MAPSQKSKRGQPDPRCSRCFASFVRTLGWSRASSGFFIWHKQPSDDRHRQQPRRLVASSKRNRHERVVSADGRAWSGGGSGGGGRGGRERRPFVAAGAYRGGLEVDGRGRVRAGVYGLAQALSRGRPAWERVVGRGGGRIVRTGRVVTILLVYC